MIEKEIIGQDNFIDFNEEAEAVDKRLGCEISASEHANDIQVSAPLFASP